MQTCVRGARMARLTMMLCAAALVLDARALAAQASDRVDRQVLVYHGVGTTSGVVRSQDGLRATTPDGGRIYLPVGSRICFDVQNALSVRYTYAVKTVVDTSPPKVEDFSLVTAALQAVLGTKTPEKTFKIMADGKLIFLPEVKAPIVEKSWYESYTDSLAPIVRGIDSATKLAAQADGPEDLAEIGLAAKTRSAGLGAAQRALLVLPDDEARIWSSRLADDLEGWYKLYAPKASAKEKMLLESMHSLGKQLLESSKTLRTNYLDATLIGRVCDTVRAGVNTMTLVASARDTTRANVRDLKNIAHIAAEPPFDRKAITVSPMAMFAMVDDVPHFVLGADSTVTRDPQRESINRIGTAIHLNAWQFQQDNSWVLGPMLGVGFGTGNDKKLVADLMAGATIGYRDVIRLGVGFGQTRVPDYIKSPASEGKRIPAGTLLNDVVGTNMRRTTYLVLTLNGLNLDVPGLTGK